MSIQLAIPALFDLTGFDGDAEPFDEDILTTDDDYLDSPMDEFGEAAAIRDIYQPARCRGGARGVTKRLPGA